MKNLLIIITIGLSSCSTDNKQREREVPAQTEPIVKPVKEKEKKTEWISITDSLFADVTYYLTETSEFYIPLSFKEDFGSTAYIELEENLDSLIFSDNSDGIKRTRLKSETAYKFFETSLLTNIRIYDVTNNYISRGKLVRFERYEDRIKDSYIAVIKPEKLPKDV